MNHNNTQEIIIEATFALLAQHGLEKTSLSMIAEKVGITKPAIYYHFPSKETLVDYIFDFIFANHSFSTHFPMNDYTKENFQERLIQDGLRMLDGYKSQPHKLRVVQEFILSAARKEKYKHKLKSTLEASLHGFCELLEHGVKMGVIPPGKTTSDAHMLALVLDSIGGYILMGVDFDYVQVWEQAVKHAMRQS